MSVSVRFAAKRSYRHYVDVSKFTEMEVEHSHDTANSYTHHGDGHVHPDTINEFTDHADSELASIKRDALTE